MEQKTITLKIRIEEKNKIRKASELSYLKMGTFIRKYSLEMADKILKLNQNEEVSTNVKQ